MKFKKFLTAALAAIMIATAFATLAGCGSNTDSTPDDGDKTVATAKADVAVVNIDINPSVELIVDKQGKVIAVRGVNDDGVMILFDEDDLIGLDLDAAVQKIIDLAKDHGFIGDGLNEAISAVVNSDNEELLNSVKSKLNTSITAKAQSTGLSLTLDLDGAYSLARRLSELKQRFPDNEAVKSLTLSKLRLALSVSETGDISLEAAIELDETRLLQLLLEADKKVEDYATEEFNAAKSSALSIYDKVAAIRTYSAYTKFYAEHATNHLLTSYYGAAYQLYASAKAGFSALLDVNGIMTQIENYGLSEEKIAEIAAIFGIEDTTPLKDANGKITIKSVEAYANKTFKNSVADELLEQKKQNLTTALNTAESAIRAEVDKLAEGYRAQIQEKLDQAETIFNNVKPTLDTVKASLEALTFIPGLSEAVSDLNEITTDFEAITAKVKAYLGDENSTLSISEFEKLVSEYGEKAAIYLEKIEADLTDAEKAELQTEIDKIAEEYSSQKQDFDKALESARESAIATLRAKKEALKNAHAAIGGEIEAPDGAAE